MAEAQWVRRWSSDNRVVQAEGSSPGGDTYHKHFFSVMIFISVLLGLIDFSDIVMLRSRPNSCCQQTLSVLICLYYRQVCFLERVAMTVKQI